MKEIYKFWLLNMYKVSKNFSPPHMNEIYEVRNVHPYNLRQNSQFSWPLVKSLYHKTESLFYLEPKVLDILHSQKFTKVPMMETSLKRLLKN